MQQSSCLSARAWLWSLLACVLCTFSAPASAPPNIVLIVADDLGYADLGVQGCSDIPTPHIDSLARNGVRCTSGYVSGPYCSPTRAGLLTGRYQQRFGHEFNPGPATVTNVQVGLSLKESTLPQHLKKAGYVTGMVGKWHLGQTDEFHPLQRGFDEYFGFLGGAHSYFVKGRETGPNSVRRGMEPLAEPEYLTDAFAREAVAFVDRHKTDTFFLYYAFNAVHTPMEAIDKYLQRFENVADPKRRTYAAMLSAMDDAVGALLSKLRQEKLEENTLLFFISDNGGPENANASNNAPLRGQKAQTWEGGIRVPFFLQWKGRLPAGRTYDAPVIQLDLLPTALAAAGLAPKPEWKLDGVNLLPYLLGETSGPPHAALFWRFGPQMAVRSGDWKLVKGPREGQRGPGAGTATLDGAQLFNLSQDIGEQTNLAESEPARVRELSTAWSAWNAGLMEPQWRPGQAATRPNAARKRAKTAP